MTTTPAHAHTHTHTLVRVRTTAKHLATPSAAIDFRHRRHSIYTLLKPPPWSLSSFGYRLPFIHSRSISLPLVTLLARPIPLFFIVTIFLIYLSYILSSPSFSHPPVSLSLSLMKYTCATRSCRLAHSRGPLALSLLFIAITPTGI